jgi:glycerophosphoryl diester phosphodiesterase
MGAAHVELDVRFSADDEVVVFHDDTLDAKTSRSGRVRHYPAGVLRRTDIGSWFDRTHPEIDEAFAGTCLVGLDEVFQELGGSVHYHIEMKGFDDWLPLRLLQCIDRHGLRERVTATSFSLRPLLKLRTLCDRIPLCFLLRDAADVLRSAEFRPGLRGATAAEVHEFWIDEAARAGFNQVGIRAADMRHRTAARAADRGLEVRGWGVGNETDLERLFERGAVGATVDWPARGLDIVGRLTSRSLAGAAAGR